jgi:hypothetical protein
VRFFAVRFTIDIDSCASYNFGRGFWHGTFVIENILGTYFYFSSPCQEKCRQYLTPYFSDILASPPEGRQNTLPTQKGICNIPALPMQPVGWSGAALAGQGLLH